jgi:predicted nucleic acid-binding protein
LFGSGLSGLGLTPEETQAHLLKFESTFLFRADNLAVYSTWRELVTKHKVSGKNAHDARIAAALITHGISSFVTFNQKDFKRFSNIEVFTPDQI